MSDCLEKFQKSPKLHILNSYLQHEKLKNKLNGCDVNLLTDTEQFAWEAVSAQELYKADTGITTMQAINRRLIICEIQNECDTIREDNPNASEQDVQRELLNNSMVMQQENIDIGDEPMMCELYDWGFLGINDQ